MSVEDRYETLNRLYDRRAVGRRIEVLRQAFELSQSAMSRLVQTKPNTISQFESGISRPSNEVELRLKAVFEITIDWLRFGETSGLPNSLADKLMRAESLVARASLAEPPKKGLIRRTMARPARKAPPLKNKVR